MTLVKFQKLKIPKKPGVYFWKKGKEILYIGKATNLYERVRSYFSKDLIDTRGPAILDMTIQATTIEYQETESVLEAVLLEVELIKKFQPKYNVKEKDNKSFYKVIITDEEWPRVMLVRSRDLLIMSKTGRLTRQKYEGPIKYSFGPFPSGTLIRDALGIIRKIFPFIDDRSSQKDQHEFYRQLNLSPVGERSEYLRTIQYIKNFFTGKKSKIVADITRQMNQAAKELRFEEADYLKRKMLALTHINDISLIKDFNSDPEEVGIVRIEAYDIAHQSGTHPVGVMTVVLGNHIDTASYRKFTMRSSKGNDDYGNLRELLSRRLSHTEWRMPNILVIDGGLGQYRVAKEVLENVRGVDIVSVIKDTRHKPKAIHGDPDVIKKYKKQILLANSEAHRFAVSFLHQKQRNASGLKRKNKTP